MNTPEPIPEELHVLAGEYVLGALDAAEMRAVSRRAMVDRGLAEAINGWERRLVPLTAAIPSRVPPDALWSRIEQAIAPLPDEGLETAAPWPPPRLAVVPSAHPVEPPPVGAPEPWRGELARLRPPPPPRRVWPWQAATVVSLALAAGVAGVVAVPSLALRLHVPMLGERFTPELALLTPADNPAPGLRPDGRTDGAAAQMASDNNTARYLGDARPDGAAAAMPADSHAAGFLAQARPDGTVLLKALATVEVPAGKVLELWILPPGAAAPKSLGVLPAAGRQIMLPAMPQNGTALMVSLEPPGGSPTGAPTGPVVYSGKLGQLRL